MHNQSIPISMVQTQDNTREVKTITPILQAILLKQIDRVGEALDNGEYLNALRRLETLWGRTPPKAKEQCRKHYMHLLTQLANCEHIRGVDTYDTLRKQNRQKIKILEVAVRPVYDTIVNALYECGYLETYRDQTQSNVPPNFWEAFTSQG